MNVLEVVEDILDRHNVYYHHLLVSNVATRNVIITDSQNVFVKMKGSDKTPEQFAADVEFFRHNPNHGFQLLVPELVHPFKRGLEGTFSVWKFEHGYNLQANSITPQQATIATSKLYDIHRSEKYPSLLRNVDDLVKPMVDHLVTVQFKILPAQLQHRIRQFFVEIAQPALWLALPPISGGVVAHGNAVPEKINRKVGGQLHWGDFETVRLTRKEYDLAQLKFSLALTGTNYAAWEAVQREYHSVHPDIDENIVDAFVGLLLVRHLIHFSSQVMDLNQESDLEELLDNMEPLLYGEIPSHIILPRLRSSLFSY